LNIEFHSQELRLKTLGKNSLKIHYLKMFNDNKSLLKILN